MLSGRLGLERARIPHADRQGLVWLDRGRLEVEDGCLRFVTAGGGVLAAGDYQIPHQAISIVLLGPGSSVTHDALRLLARHGCALAAIGEGAVLKDAYIGPYTAVAEGCEIERAEIENSIVLENSRIADLHHRLEGSLIGRNVVIGGQNSKPSAYRILVGDDSHIGIL